MITNIVDMNERFKMFLHLGIRRNGEEKIGLIKMVEVRKNNKFEWCEVKCEAKRKKEVEIIMMTIQIWPKKNFRGKNLKKM